MFQRGELKLEGVWADLLHPDQRDDWISGLETIDWNVFVEGPPDGKSDPKQVLMYLARYMTGGPISDARLISHQNDEVTFWARSKDKRAGNPSEPFTLKCVEFVRRWAMHILPKAFTKTRRYGGFSGAKCKDYLQHCRELLSIVPEAPEPVAAQLGSESNDLKCPKCQCELELVKSTTRPSWRKVFERLYRDPEAYSPMWHVDCFTTRPPPFPFALGKSDG